MSDRRLLDNLIKEFLKIKSESEMKTFLEGILTPKELLELPTRLEIIRLLKGGVAQHAIAEKLGVGIATVTRGSKAIQEGNFKNVK